MRSHVSGVMHGMLYFGPYAGLLFCKLPCLDRLGSSLLQMDDAVPSA